MDDISRELGISKKTLYQFVQNKKELVRMVFSRDFMEFKDRSNRLMEGPLDPVKKFYYFLNSCLQSHSGYQPALTYSLEKYYPVLEVEMRTLYRNFAEDTFRKIYEEGCSQSLFLPGFDKVFGWSCLAVLDAKMKEINQDPENTLSTDFFEKLFLFLSSGMVTEKGALFINKMTSKKCLKCSIKKAPLHWQKSLAMKI